MSTYDNDQQYDTYEDDEGQQNDGLPILQGRHGDPANNTAFRFFLSADNAPEGFTPGDPWKPHSEYFKETKSRVAGWMCEALPMYIICAKAQPFKKGADGKREKWVSVWPQDAPPNSHAMHAEVLLIAQGLEDLGPVKWVTNGSSIAFAIIADVSKRQPQGGILAQIRARVLAESDKISKKVTTRQKAKAYWAFCITVGGARKPNGAPLYTDTPSGTTITLPVAYLPVNVDAAWLKDHYAGAEFDAHGRQLRAEFETWRAQRRSDEPVAPPPQGRSDEPVSAPPQGRNMPQFMTDDDLPF